MSHRVAALIAVATASVCLAACSSSHSGSPSGGVSNPTSAAAPPPTKADLSGYLLTAADLPSGWTGAPSTTSASDEAANRTAFLTCSGAVDTSTQRRDSVDSDDFTLDNATISSSASSYSSHSAVDSDESALFSRQAAGCFKQLLSKELTTSLPSGATIGSLDVSVTPGSGGGPSAVIATASATITVTISGQSTKIYAGVAFIAGPLVEAEVDFENVGSKIDSSVQSMAIAAVAQRVANG